MSNIVVGVVYQKIIEDVIDNCGVMFEEEGVERKLIDEMAETWKHKLSERKVAQMSWDPAPAPTAPALSTVRPTPSIGAGAPAPTISAADGAVHVKREAADYDTGYGNLVAMQRASSMLQERFGNAAAPQVTTLQAQVKLAATVKHEGAGASAPPAPPPAPPAPAATQPQAQPQQPQPADQRRSYQEYLEQQTRLKQQQPALQNPQAATQRRAAVANGQTDGAGDWADMVATRRADAAGQTAAADLLLRERIEQDALDLEGGGLMRPLSEHPRRRAVRATPAANPTDAPSAAASAIPQGDGAGDADVKAEVKADPDADEDAINSDLDDPEEDAVEEAEDEQTSELMLCTYDKVQRVKNKWKCTLKDGVLTTGGKEYLFHKAQGEFEW